ncbi:MAG: hypothetical protein CM1200mP29_14430 [Verrucomicrobiota bacterium]|nr:MAG: hypothetical protein CM1200mP29_14430 [Verrucomicrobiota bacterium]
MYLFNIGIPVAIARIGQVPGMSPPGLAGPVGLPHCRGWLGPFGLELVPDEWHVLVFISGGVAFFAMQFPRPAREWQWLALAYAVIGYLLLAARSLIRMRFGKAGGDRCAVWVQQMARRFEVDKKGPTGSPNG